jgi:hypothetical protein
MHRSPDDTVGRQTYRTVNIQRPPYSIVYQYYAVLIGCNEAVKKHSKKWAAVAALVPCRTNNQYRQRCFYMDPANAKKAGKWSPEEDAELK